MKHELFWDEDNYCARMKLVGKFSPDEAAEMMDAIRVLLSDKHPRNLLVDHTHSTGSLSAETRKTLEEKGRLVGHDKHAFYGMNGLNRMVAKIIVAIIGKASDTRFFKTEEDALAWLKE